MSLTPNEMLAPLSHVHGGRGAAGRVWLVPHTGSADKPAPAAKGSHGAERIRRAMPRRTILYAEDHAAVRLAVRDRLEMEGGRSRLAPTAARRSRR